MLGDSRKPTILLVDDHEPMLRTVAGVVAPHFEVVAAVSNGQEAVDAAARTKPDVVLSDIAMPGLDGIRAARELKKRDSRAKVVFLTVLGDDDYISEALSVGATGYVLKGRIQSDLVPALNLALAGTVFISPHAFTGAPKFLNDTHTLHLYSDETIFFDHVSQLTYTALSKSEQVLLFMSKIGLHFIRKRLCAMGLDCFGAIERGDLHAFSVENLFPALTKGAANLESIERLEFRLFSEISEGGQPDPLRFEAFFGRFLDRALDRSSKTRSNILIVSDLMAALLRQGYDHQFVACAENVWNDLVPKQSCVVYCGCPAVYLGYQDNRQMLAGICAQHSNVVAFDRHAERSGYRDKS